MILAPLVQAKLDKMTEYFLGELKKGKPFEAEIKFTPQHQDVTKRLVFRVTLDNPTE